MQSDRHTLTQVQIIQSLADALSWLEKGNKLSFDDAVNVWLRYWSGEFQEHIAASYRPPVFAEDLRRMPQQGAKD